MKILALVQHFLQDHLLHECHFEHKCYSVPSPDLYFLDRLLQQDDWVNLLLHPDLHAKHLPVQSQLQPLDYGYLCHDVPAQYAKCLGNRPDDLRHLVSDHNLP